ncbi:MAG: DUF2500 domain-containing protein [Eubacteriales bacterium]|nr:DUF2500 domain-containing protein [Eubacteriales bacterium]
MNVFSFFPFFFVIVFIFIFGIIIYTVIRGVSRWNKNNKSPVLTVPVIILAKRGDISYHRHNSGGNNMGHTTSSTTYYVTFQVESGDRIELIVPDDEFGMLVEGDTGRLTFQGTRYKGFEREIKVKPIL